MFPISYGFYLYAKVFRKGHSTCLDLRIIKVLDFRRPRFNPTDACTTRGYFLCPDSSFLINEKALAR